MQRVEKLLQIPMSTSSQMLSVRVPDNFESGELLFAFMQKLDFHEIRLKLQRVFVLLCAHIMCTPDKYEQLADKCREWKSRRARRDLLAAELFVCRLCQVSESDMDAILQGLCGRFREFGEIKSEEYRSLLEQLEQGTAALQDYLRPSTPRLIYSFDDQDDADSVTDENRCNTPVDDRNGHMSSLNQSGELNSKCPGCDTPCQKYDQSVPACDALFCVQPNCETSFCFF